MDEALWLADDQPTNEKTTQIMQPFTPEQDQHLQIMQVHAYYQGLVEGVRSYAWWRDGIEYVGTSGKTLKTVLDEITLRKQRDLEKINRLLNL